MKRKILTISVMCAVVLSAAGCGGNTASTTTAASTAAQAQEETTTTAASEAAQTEAPAEDTTPAQTEDAAPAEDGAVMTYEEYKNAAIDDKVTVETYVQAKQGWWENNGVGNASFYTQDLDGGYFLYNMPCTQEEYDKLVPGTKIRVTGFKSEWSGEVEITDSTFEIIDGDTYNAFPYEITDYLGADFLVEFQNMYVAFKGLTVEPIKDADGAEHAFLYSYDGSGSDGDDLYFNVGYEGNTYTFTVESYLCGAGTEVYEAVKALNIGDLIDTEGFLYWYNGANPHITSVAPAEVSNVMSFAEYSAAAIDDPVTVETFVQAKQGWWENNGVGNASFYTQDTDGGYFLYNMPCTQEEYNSITEGTMLRVSGYKAEWSGEIEIIDSTFEILDGLAFTANPQDVTALLGKDELIQYQNMKVSFKGLTVAPKTDADGNEVAFLYSYDGSGEEGSDLYFDVTDGTNTYTFTVESYLCGPETQVYQDVKALNVGDVIDLEGFLYWYNGANPHITSVSAAG